MSYGQSLDTAFRPALYQASAETLVPRPKPEPVATGAEKSNALSELESVRASAVFPGDRKGSTAYANTRPDSGTDAQSLSFSDLVDVINPLQHIPLISSAYRALTGDEISAPARVAGSTLYFGPIGAASAMVNLVTEEITGKDVGSYVASLFSGDTPESDPSDTIETADAGDLSAASSISSNRSPSLGVLAENDPLSPDEPFVFEQIPSAMVPESARAIGFAGPSEPVALESLPADILSALYSGQPLRPTTNGDNSVPDIVTESNAQEPALRGLTGHENTTDVAPRWSLWSSPDDSLARPTSAINSYGGFIPENAGVPGGISNQAGWTAASAPEVLARYQDSVNLQRQTSKSYLDVSQ